MEIITRAKQIQREITANLIIEKKFIDSLSYRKYIDFEVLLDNEGTFCNLSKKIFIAKLFKILSKQQHFTCKYSRAVSIDKLPGNKAHQFVFKKQELDKRNGRQTTSRSFLNKFRIDSETEENEMLLNFVILIEGGLITRIEVPKKFIINTVFQSMIEDN